MIAGDVVLLRCPSCRSELRFRPRDRLASRTLRDGVLECVGCGASWPVADGVPRLVDEHAVQRDDRFMRRVYDWFACVHDPAVRYLLPLLQFGSADALRDRYMERLELRALAPHADGSPVRILEVGVGCGANLPLIERDLPPGLPVEVWGLDLSEGMLARCAGRVGGHPRLDVKLLLADAHALPFPAGAFDRVFHVGGIAAFCDPARALAEMARVARGGTPIVVVDEQLDPSTPQCLYHRLTYAALTLFAPAEGSPAAHLPAGAERVVEEQISRFYYGLTFRMPPG
jgi:ubiquinone/menaquinone biosynthesis C-methylase UbiE